MEIKEFTQGLSWGALLDYTLSKRTHLQGGKVTGSKARHSFRRKIHPRERNRGPATPEDQTFDH